jgi:hypothetical protein
MRLDCRSDAALRARQLKLIESNPVQAIPSSRPTCVGLPWPPRTSCPPEPLLPAAAMSRGQGGFAALTFARPPSTRPHLRAPATVAPLVLCPRAARTRLVRACLANLRRKSLRTQRDRRRCNDRANNSRWRCAHQTRERLGDEGVERTLVPTRELLKAGVQFGRYA